MVRPFPALRAGPDDARSQAAAGARRRAGGDVSRRSQRATLTNGLKVVLLERHSTPLVNVTLAVDAGYAADDPAKRRHSPRSRSNLLEKARRPATPSRSSTSSTRSARACRSRSSLDLSFVRLQALPANLDAFAAAAGRRGAATRRSPPTWWRSRSASRWRGSTRSRPIRGRWRCASCRALLYGDGARLRHAVHGHRATSRRSTRSRATTCLRLAPQLVPAQQRPR